MSDPRQTQSIFTRGAVDLGAARARQPIRPRAHAIRPAAGAARGPSSGVSCSTSPRPLSRTTSCSVRSPPRSSSTSGPTWCQPRQQLSPLLEKLAADGEGTWLLGQASTSTPTRGSPRRSASRASRWSSRSSAGSPSTRSTGVLPEAQLRQWIDAVLKAGGVEVERGDDPRLLAADDALMDGDLDARRAGLPEDPRRHAGRPDRRVRARPGRPAAPRPRARPRGGPRRRRRRPAPRSCSPPTSRC